MAIYVISYDLKQPGRNYEPLWQALRNANAVRALESLWLVEVNQTASQLREALSSFMDSNDRVFVAEITISAAWAMRNGIVPAATWLQQKRP
jgi:hypothetical protein